MLLFYQLEYRIDRRNTNSEIYSFNLSDWTSFYPLFEPRRESIFIVFNVYFTYNIFDQNCAVLQTYIEAFDQMPVNTRTPPPPPHTHIRVWTFNHKFSISGILHATVAIHFRVFTDEHGLFV